MPLRWGSFWETSTFCASPSAVGSNARRTVRWTCLPLWGRWREAPEEVLSENGPVRARWDPMRQHWARAFGRPPEEVPEGRRGGYPIPQLSVKNQKVAATLDTPPPMLYNGIAIGKHPRCSSETTARNASEQVATAGGISHLTLKAEVNRQRETCNSNQQSEKLDICHAITSRLLYFSGSASGQIAQPSSSNSHYISYRSVRQFRVIFIRIYPSRLS